MVADPNRESATALQYALSRVLVANDALILLHVEQPNSGSWKIPFNALFRRPSANGSLSSPSLSSSMPTDGCGGSGGAIDFLGAMKHACGMAYPKLTVHAEKVGMDGKDKASLILAQSINHVVELLIIGQKTTLSNAILG